MTGIRHDRGSLDQGVENDGLIRLLGPFRRLGRAFDAAGGEEPGEKEADEKGANSHGGKN